MRLHTNRVRALKTETMHSSKTTLTKLSTKESDSINLASICMRSRTTTLLASEGLASHYDFELAACLQANVWPTHTRDWLALSLSNNETGSIFRWCLNDATFGIPLFESMLRQ